MSRVAQFVAITFFTFFLTASSVAQPALHLDRSFGPPTSELVLDGRGFSANTQLFIYFDQQQVGLATTDSNGSFSNVVVKLPTDALPGAHQVVAVDSSGGTTQVMFNVETAWAEYGFTSRGHRNNYLENVLNATNVSQVVQYFNFTTFHTLAITPPAISHGLVFFGSTDSHMYAFDAVTGHYVWDYATRSEVLASGAAVYNDTVYFGGEDHFVYALDAPTGHLKWKFAAENCCDIWSSPTVVNDVVYIGGGAANVYALDPVHGTLLWTFTTGGLVTCAPAVVNGVVYFTSFDNYVYAVDATDGSLIWSVPTPYGLLFGSPAVADGMVYIPALDATYALDASTGAVIWKNTSVSNGDTSPAVANGVVYVAWIGISALDAKTGQVIWSNSSLTDLATSPLVANGVVYVAGASMYAIDAATGTVLWQSPTNGNPAYSSPAVANGIIYFSDGHNGLYAFGLPGGNKQGTSP